VTSGEPPDDAELIAKLASLDVIEPPPGWVDRAVERWEQRQQPQAAPPRRRRWRWGAAAAVVVAAVAAAVAFVPRCGSARHDELVVAVAHRGPPDRAGGTAVGDTMTATARVSEPHEELRIYRDDRLVVRCPGDAACRRDGAKLTVALTFDRPGRYQVVVLAGTSELPEPTPQGMTLDLLQASERGARVARQPAIDVR